MAKRSADGEPTSRPTAKARPAVRPTAPGSDTEGEDSPTEHVHIPVPPATGSTTTASDASKAPAPKAPKTSSLVSNPVFKAKASHPITQGLWPPAAGPSRFHAWPPCSVTRFVALHAHGGGRRGVCTCTFLRTRSPPPPPLSLDTNTPSLWRQRQYVQRQQYRRRRHLDLPEGPTEVTVLIRADDSHRTKCILFAPGQPALLPHLIEQPCSLQHVSACLGSVNFIYWRSDAPYSALASATALSRYANCALTVCSSCLLPAKPCFRLSSVSPFCSEAYSHRLCGPTGHAWQLIQASQPLARPKRMMSSGSTEAWNGPPVRHLL